MTSNPKKTIILAIAAFVAVILLVGLGSYFLGRGWLQIAADISGNTPLQVTVRNEAGESLKTFELAAGSSKKVFVKTGGVRIDTTAGTGKGITVAKVKRLSTAHVAVSVGTQHAIRKIASDGDICPFYKNGITYTFNCSGDSPIYRQLALDPERLDPKEILFGEEAFGQLTPIGDGLIGFLDGESPSASEFVFIDPANETVTTINLPDGAMKSIYERPTIVPSDDPTSMRYVLKFAKANKLYYVDGVTNPKVTEISLAQGVKLGSDTHFYSMQLTPDGLLMHESLITAETAGHEAEDEPALDTAPGLLYQYNLDGQVRSVIKTPDTVASGGVEKISDAFYSSGTREGIAFYYYKDKKFSKVYEMTNASSAVRYGGKAYFRASGTAYVFTPGKNASFSLQSVFSSPAIAVSELFATPQGILFTGFAKRGEQPVPRDVYVLLDTPQQTPPLEETLNFDTLSSFLTEYDYDDTTVLCTLRITSSADYDTLQAKLRERFASLGMETGDRKIVLNYLN